MKVRMLITGIAIMASIGCKVESKGSSNSNSEFYSYEFTENGCWTGVHTAASVPSICTKLEDHTLNKGCAYGLRASKYKDYNCFTVLGSKPSVSASVAPSESSTSSLSYEVTENGCYTGKQKFTSKTEFCAGLMNHALNNYCALATRQILFASHECK